MVLERKLEGLLRILRRNERDAVPVRDEDDLEPSDDEYSARKTLEDAFRSVSLDPGAPHFFGKSSSFMFLQKALDIRQGYVNEALAPVIADPVASPASFPIKRLEFWNTHPVSLGLGGRSTHTHA